MAKKKKKPLECAPPSKAYLVSFGDTMTALLAFFIVINSLAKEQTGANMHSGTGSFVNAFASSGLPGTMSGNRSKDVLSQESQMPVYALAENLDRDPDQSVGPDDTDAKERIMDREKEQFQKFLDDIDKTFGLKNHAPLEDQTVVDSFSPIIDKKGKISRESVELLSDSIAKLRSPETNLEIIIWASMPSKNILDKRLETSKKLRSEIERVFWLKQSQRSRMRIRVKPWLFSDAKRPVLSVVSSKSGSVAE